MMKNISLLLLFYFSIFQFSYSQGITKDTIEARKAMIKGDSLLKKAQYNAAIKNYKLASKLYQTHQLWRHYLNTENEWGYTLIEIGHYEKAMKKMKNAIQNAKKYGLEKSLISAISYDNYGITYEVSGNYSQALAQYKEALKIKTTLFGEHHQSLAYSYNNIGITYIRLGSYPQALKYYKKALKVYRKKIGEESIEVAHCHNGIGVIYKSLGRHQQALEQYKKGLKIFRKHFGEQHPQLTNSYTNIGNIYHFFGKYHQALELQKKVLKTNITYLGEQHPRTSISYNNIANTYFSLGKYHQALELYKKALKSTITSFGEQHPDVATFYLSVGNAYFELGMYDKALAQYKESLKIQTMHFGEQHPKVASSYFSIGNIYKSLGKYQQALVQYEKSLKMKITFFGELHYHITDIYFNIALVHEKLNNYNLALKYYQKVLQSNDASVSINLTSQHKLKKYLDAKILLKSLSNKGRILQLAPNDSILVDNRMELALNTYQMADTLIQQMRRDTWNEKDKLQLAVSSIYNYPRAMTTTLQLYQKQQERHYLDKAFYFSEQNRASILLGSQTEKEALTFGNVPDSLVALEKDLKIEKAFYKKQLQQQKDSAKIAADENNLFVVNRRLDSLTQFMESVYSDYYQMKYSPKIRSLNEVQTQLTESELLLHYLWGKDTIYGFSISKHNVSIKKITIDSTFLNAPSSLMEYFKSSNRLNTKAELVSYQKVAYNIYQNLVEPLLKDSSTKTKKLIIVPDGPLSQIPFEVLTTQAPHTKHQSFQSLPYLLKDYTIRYSFSASLAFEFEQSKNSKKSLISFGGFAPSYNDTNVSISKTKDSLENTISLKTMRTLYGDMSTIPPLFHNLREVKTINDIIKGDVIGGEMATINEFKRIAPNYRILHIAAHGWVNDSLPEFSGIAFAINNKLLKNKDYNFLQMHEIYNMNLNAELVVLSACQTGVGTFQRGEGVMNLGRAFRYAGCPNVVVSQWNVNDANTAELMGYFYTFLSEGVDKDSALQRAKLEFLANNKFATPFQWGAFVLWGDDKPIKINNTYWWYYLGVSVIVIGFLLLVYRLKKKRVSTRFIK